MNSGTTMPASSQNSDLKKTNKHIINSSTQLCQLRLGGKQLSHRRKSANDTQNIPSTGEKLDGELQTAGSVLGKRNAERPYLHWNHKVVRAVPEKTSPRSSALRGPSSTSSRLIPSSPLLLLLSSPLQLLDKFADVNKHSVSAAKALWWNNTWKRRGKTRPERPGEAAMYVRGCSCKTKNIQTSQKISPLVIIINIYIV